MGGVLDDDEDCGYYIEETIAGNTIRDVLGMTQYETHDLVSKVKAQVDAGVLVIEDCEVVATQFIDALTATTFKPMLFNFDAPTEQRIAYVVKIAVRAFLAAYGKK